MRPRFPTLPQVCANAGDIFEWLCYWQSAFHFFQVYYCKTCPVEGGANTIRFNLNLDAGPNRSPSIHTFTIPLECHNYELIQCANDAWAEHLSHTN